MKTPLPKRIEYEPNGDHKILYRPTINQLIDYLAELTEEAEGKELNRYVSDSIAYQAKQTPSLKETDTAELVAFCEIDGVAVSLWKIDKLFKLSVSGSREYTQMITIKDNQTPSLKEPLLEELKFAREGEPDGEYEKGFDHGLYHAEIIVKRLMP